MPKPRDTQSGISSFDVLVLQSQLENDYVGRISIELVSLPTGPYNRFRWTLVAANYVGLYRTPRNTRAVVQTVFPSHKYKTLPGAMFALLYQLHDELEQLRSLQVATAGPLEQAAVLASHADNPEDRH